jgi:hypothetical protein
VPQHLFVTSKSAMTPSFAGDRGSSPAASQHPLRPTPTAHLARSLVDRDDGGL